MDALRGWLATRAAAPCLTGLLPAYLPNRPDERPCRQAGRRTHARAGADARLIAGQARLVV